MRVFKKEFLLKRNEDLFNVIKGFMPDKTLLIFKCSYVSNIPMSYVFMSLCPYVPMSIYLLNVHMLLCP